MLARGYKVPPANIEEAIRRLLRGANVRVNNSAAEAGLAMLDAGGDFADGVIAHHGRWPVPRCSCPSIGGRWSG
jgi:hypothetical protein